MACLGHGRYERCHVVSRPFAIAQLFVHVKLFPTQTRLFVQKPTLRNPRLSVCFVSCLAKNDLLARQICPSFLFLRSKDRRRCSRMSNSSAIFKICSVFTRGKSIRTHSWLGLQTASFRRARVENKPDPCYLVRDNQKTKNNGISQSKTFYLSNGFTGRNSLPAGAHGRYFRIRRAARL